MEFQILFVYMTVLHYASQNENLPLVKFLVSLNKFDLKAKDIFKKNIVVLITFLYSQRFYAVSIFCEYSKSF